MGTEFVKGGQALMYTCNRFQHLASVVFLSPTLFMLTYLQQWEDTSPKSYIVGLPLIRLNNNFLFSFMPSWPSTGNPCVAHVWFIKLLSVGSVNSILHVKPKDIGCIFTALTDIYARLGEICAFDFYLWKHTMPIKTIIDQDVRVHLCTCGDICLEQNYSRGICSRSPLSERVFGLELGLQLGFHLSLN